MVLGGAQIFHTRALFFGPISWDGFESFPTQPIHLNRSHLRHLRVMTLIFGDVAWMLPMLYPSPSTQCWMDQRALWFCLWTLWLPWLEERFLMGQEKFCSSKQMRIPENYMQNNLRIRANKKKNIWGYWWERSDPSCTILGSAYITTVRSRFWLYWLSSVGPPTNDRSSRRTPSQ